MAFDPTTLFASSEEGGLYDPSDISTLWKDTAGTDPVTTDGDLVARMDDLSGNGNHMVQSNEGSRPTYKTDAGGNAYLAFDGTDDALSVSLSMSQPWDRISAIQQAGWTLNRRVFGGSHAQGELTQNASTPQLRMTGTGASALQNNGLAAGANGVVTERYISGGSKLAVNNGAYTTVDIGAASPVAFTIGAITNSGSNASNIRFYGAIIREAMTDEEIGGTREWLGGRAGLNLSLAAPRSYGVIY